MNFQWKKVAPLNLLPDDDDSSEEHDGEDNNNKQDNDEDPPTPEELSILYLTVKKKGFCPLDENVGNIISRNISAKCKGNSKEEETSAIERATLRYGSSRIIDLSTNMKDWFSTDDRNS
jgi:hypothetical protein